MHNEIAAPSQSTAEQLRPVVITVILAKLAVFVLLMTTINLPVTAPSSLEAGIVLPLEVAAIR